MNQEQLENMRYSIVNSLLPHYGSDARALLLAANCVVQTGVGPVVSKL